MMKLSYRNIFTILFLFGSLVTLWGQNSFRIIYNIEPNFNLSEMRNQQSQSMAILASEVMADFEFELLIDSNESIFKQSEQLVKDDIDPLLYELASGFCSGHEIWYSNNEESIKKIALLNSDPLTILSLNEKVEWEISDEVKQIGKFKALKATATRKLGSYLEEIEVWFAPELPFSFGPVGYNGLPGLILELHRGSISYKFKEIKEEKVEIKLPKSSKEMSFEKYYQLLDENMADIKKRG